MIIPSSAKCGGPRRNSSRYESDGGSREWRDAIQQFHGNVRISRLMDLQMPEMMDSMIIAIRGEFPSSVTF